MTILVVLGLLSITLAFSYAMVRMQVTATQMQSNSGRNLDARQAAMTGMSVALQKMSASGWGGVDVPLSGVLGSGLSYAVKYTTGDVSLTSSSTDYTELPFRVTIVSTGTATDPANANNTATYKIQAVVQLIRRSLSASQSAWTNLQTYTLYQWGSNPSTVEIPVRIEGKTRLNAAMNLAAEYPPSSARTQYFADLYSMIAAGYGDYRPFNGTVEWKQSSQSATTQTLMTLTQAPKSNVSISSYSAPFSHPGAVTTYRLYTGGKQYTIPLLQGDSNGRISSVTYEPDIATNPLGVFRTSAKLLVGNGAVIRGAVITNGSDPDLVIDGATVRLEGVNLPALSGATRPVQLPVATVLDDVSVASTCSQLTLKGAVVSWGDFEVQRGGTVVYDLQGRVFTQNLYLNGQTAWDTSLWSDWLTTFTAQSTTGITHFPRWVEQKKSFPAKPPVTLKPISNLDFHWPDWTQPIYQPHANDGGGLRWDVVSWKDNP